MKLLTILLLPTLYFTPVDAATFNFEGLTEQNFSEAFPSGYTNDGITLKATANKGAKAFIDGTSKLGPAGLGVCSFSSCVTGVEGAVTSDDNLTRGEKLFLNFNEKVFLTEVVIRDKLHKKVETGKIRINGVNHTIANGVAVLSLPADDQFRLQTTKKTPQAYLSTADFQPVPLPAAAWLLLGGIAALGGLSWRKRRAV